MKTIKRLTAVCVLIFLVNINSTHALDNLSIVNTNDSKTNSEKCPVSLSVKNDLTGTKKIDYSILDCIYYKTDASGNYIYDDDGQKVMRDENDSVSFACAQKFLDSYSNAEFKEAANNKTADGFLYNKYCPVYCVEENKLIFPGYSPIVNSGEHFTWTLSGNNNNDTLGLTARLHGTRVCRSQVNLNDWIKDYSDIMHSIENDIKIEDPITHGNGSCTPDANYDNSDSESVCTWDNKPYHTATVLMTSNDYNMLGNYAELEKLSGNVDYTVVLGALGVVPESDSIADLTQEVSAADSNRYYITSAIISEQSTDRNIQGATTDIVMSSNSNDTIIASDTENPQYARNQVLDLARADGSTAIVTVKIEIWERRCCKWEKTGDKLWNGSPFISSVLPATPGSLPAVGQTWGYRSESIKDGCGVTGLGSGVSPFITAPDGTHCCGGWMAHTGSCTSYSCSIPGLPASSVCLYAGGTIKCDSYGPTTYTCSENVKQYSLDTKWIVKCPSENTEATQAQVKAGSSKKCTYSYSIPTCKTGYSYAPTTGKCYKADIRSIYRKLTALANLRVALKSCNDVLKDFDYHLDTEMAIEYNKTGDTIKNSYFPSKDGVTDTNLKKVTTNTVAEDGENKIGEYSSNVFKPSEKSSVTGSVTFFGKTYYFGKDSIPYVVCTLSGLEKICGAAQNSAYSDYWYDWYGKTYVAMYEYRLVDNFYKWVLMPSGKSQSTKPTGTYQENNTYIDVGKPNYPVHFNTAGGNYEGLNIRISGLGYQNNLYKSYVSQLNIYNNNLTDTYIKGSQSEAKSELLYDCYYQVKEGKPYCPTSGCSTDSKDDDDLGSVRLIYRPISLEEPFPSMGGEGRVTGSNWCDSTKNNCLNNDANATVNKYILTNRNVSGSSVYNKEPMYKITLTPNLIKQIRIYNDGTTYDDFNLYCNSGTVDKEKQGRECRSNFVVGGLDDVSLPTLKDYFEASSTCGTNNDFYACDKLDNYER